MGNDGRLANYKLYTIGKIHRRKSDIHQQNKKRRILDTNKSQQQSNLLVSGYRRSKKLLEHRNSPQPISKWKHKNKTTGEINQRIQMLQQQQNQHTRHNPSGHHIWIISSKEMPKTTSRH